MGVEAGPPAHAGDTDALRAFDQRINSLRRPGACAGLSAEATRLDTHVSTLLFAGERVFKFMRPVHFGFVDFRTLAARRAACVEELRLNRRTAPGWYLGLAAVRDTAQGPVLSLWAEADADGDGSGGASDTTVLDWALLMRRFDDAQRLDRLAARGELGAMHIDALAVALVRFQAALPPSPPALALAHPDSIRRWARDNLAELRALLAASASASASVAPAGNGGPPPAAGKAHSALLAALDALSAWTESRGTALMPLMQARAAPGPGPGTAGGHVREGHGDLHLANIVWADGAPLVFDALAFASTLRHTDTVGDLAFVFMDLLAHGLPRLAWRWINAVLDASGDHEGLPLLPWWTVYRALVRAKVALLSAGRGEGLPTAPTALDRAAALIALAQQQAAPGVPSLVLTCGLSGSAKSTVAGLLAERLGALRVRADVERKRLFGLAATDRVPPLAGLYTPEATQRTYGRLAEVAALALGAGLSVVVDAASLRRSERDAMRGLAARHGARFTLLCCEAPAAVLQARVEARSAAGLDASDATVEVLHQQQRFAEWPGADEAADTLRLDTDGAPEAVVQRCEALPLGD